MTRRTLTDWLLPTSGPTELDDRPVDEGLWEVAAMVYVGDVYAVIIADQAQAEAATSKAKKDADEALWPFIR
ncbi:MAG: hypothetical protein ACLGHO_06975 [Gammaproteobacteria bacterium]